jgi:hypothetical protein
MKTVYMRQVYMGTIGDMKNLEQHYADMAEKGWMIDRIGVFTHRYHSIEPCKKRFFVDLLPQITSFDYPENDDAQEYRRICEESGWTFITTNKQFHIFCADGENPAPIPIHTDNAIHAKIYLKACRKYELPWLLYVLLMSWFFSPIGRGVESFLSNISFFMGIGYFLFIIGYVWILGFVIRWYIRTRKSAKNNLPMPRVNQHLAKFRCNVFAAGAAALMACMIIGIVLEISGGMPLAIGLAAFMPFSALAVGFWIKRQIDTKRRTRAANIGITVIAIVIMEIIILGCTSFAIMNMPLSQNSDSLDNRPALTLNDIGVTTPSTHSNVHVDGTPVVPIVYKYWESNTDGSVSTDVYRSVNRTLAQWLYIHFAEEFTHTFRDIRGHAPESIVDLPADEATYWGAEKGLMFSRESSNASDAVELLLWNGKTILRLSADGSYMNFTNQAVRNLWRELS